MIEYICEFLKMNDVEYDENLNLSDISPIKIGGKASVVAYPCCNYQYLQILRFLGKANYKYKILGRMSNVLPSDDGFKGVVVKTDRMRSITKDKNVISVSAGTSLYYVAMTTAELGLSGAEELSGIPGSVGGAIYNNAGAFGREISDIITCVSIYDPVSDSVYSLSTAELHFAYRTSVFSTRPWVIISATLALSDADSNSINARIKEFVRIRRQTQPLGEMSLGSTFKRPSPSLAASLLIDKCGLKGYTVGGASVSNKHAGFIVNNKNATASDYLSVAEHVVDNVKEKFGVVLEKEIELL